MASIALPRFGPVLSEIKLNADARQMAGVLRMARSEAITSGENRPVVFYVNDNNNPRYRYIGKSTYKLSPGVKFVSATPFISQYNNQPACIFYPSGKAKQGGTVSLKADNRIKYVIVLNSTGRIRVSNSPPDSWER